MIPVCKSRIMKRDVPIFSVMTEYEAKIKYQARIDEN